MMRINLLPMLLILVTAFVDGNLDASFTGVEGEHQQRQDEDKSWEAKFMTDRRALVSIFRRSVVCPTYM